MRRLKKVVSLTVVTAILAAAMDMGSVEAAQNFAMENGEAVVQEVTQSEPNQGAEDDFQIEDGVLVKYRGAGGDVVVPDGVTSIGDFAFDGCSSLSSIEIPGSVTEIGNYAFGGCSSLSSINVVESNEKYLSEDGVLYTKDGKELICCPGGKKSISILESVTRIGHSAFEGCSSLSSIKLPDSVTEIGSAAFYYCSSLSSIKLPDSVTEIGNYAFNGCSSLSSIEIPGSVTEIGNYAFNGCSSLSSIELPDSVTSIGERMFAGCSSLSSIKLPDSVTSIGDYAFNGCSSLSSIEIPGSVTSIGSYAFNGCSSLSSIKLPESVTSIEEVAFNGCSSLSSIEIPGSVTSIGYSAFSGCDKLTILCEKGSEAEDYAKIHNIPYKYIGDMGEPMPSAEPTQEATPSAEPTQEATPSAEPTQEATSSAEPTQEPTPSAEPTQGEPTPSAEPTQEAMPSAEPTQGEPTPSVKPAQEATPSAAPTQTLQKVQTIKANNFTKVYGTEAFSIGAKTNGNGKLSYTSGNKKVAVVSERGRVTITGCGKTTITIKASETKEYKAAEKKITITIKPSRQKISSVKSTASKTFTVKWKKDTKATGYILQYSTDKKFKKNVKNVLIANNKTTSKKVSKLKAGKKYYVRICSYKTVSKTKIQGSYSAVKSVTAKK
ncbi:MAG: leucine-rich repeat protein [Lachnospiraceae bacterium]|nr:leucine-rich repeat protein [Lachnospiraceae bacterium]